MVNVKGKKIILVTLGALTAVGLSACGSNQGANSGNTAQSNNDSKSGAPVEIVYQSWVTPNLTAEFYDNAIKRFEEKNPGIKVKRIQPPANEGSADNYLKTQLAAGDFPDVVQNATISLFVKADALAEIPIDDDIKKINNYESDLINGKLYDIAGTRQPHSLIFYNKKLFQQAGITATPKTWAEFEQDCEKLKAQKITPIITAGDWTSGFDFSMLTSPTVYENNKNWYTDRFADKVHFTDPDWLEAANYFNDLVKKSYFNEGALSIDYNQAQQDFLSGKGAMYPMGVWFSAAEAKAQKDFEVGVFPAPTKDGKQDVLGIENGGLFAISKTSKHQDAALKFAKFMMFDQDTGKELLKADALLSNLKEPIQYDMSPLQKEISDIMKNVPTMVAHYNNKVGSVPVSGIQDQYNKVAQDLLMGKADVKAEMQSLDDYWSKNNKK